MCPYIVPLKSKSIVFNAVLVRKRNDQITSGKKMLEMLGVFLVKAKSCFSSFISPFACSIPENL